MATEQQKSDNKKIVMVSPDPELVRMAKGAFASSDQQHFLVIEKAIGEIGPEIRDQHCDALILDIDAANVADFEHLQKIKRMVGSGVAVIVISESFSPAAARILIQLKVADFLVKPLQTSDFVRACNNSLKTTGESAQVEPQFLAFMPATGGVGTTAMALETAAILNRYG